MELAPVVYETNLSDPATAFILDAAEVQLADPAPDTTPGAFDSSL